MKHIFVLFVCWHLCNAETQVWTSGDRDGTSVSSLFSKYCSGNEDSGFDGNIMWICKRAIRQTPIVENHLHIFETIPQAPGRKQIIFLENPPNEYKHMIFVQGQIYAHPKTNVYVLPGRDTHTLAVTKDIKSSVSVEKPSIFFAKDEDESKPQYVAVQSGPVKDDTELSAISSANSFEYTKHPRPPTYVKRTRRVKMTKIIREKRNYGVQTGKSQIRPISLFEEKKNSKREVDQSRSVTLHYRRRNPARFGYGQNKQDNDGQEEYVSASSSYYPTPHQHLRPVYVRPQN